MAILSFSAVVFTTLTNSLRLCSVKAGNAMRKTVPSLCGTIQISQLNGFFDVLQGYLSKGLIINNCASGTESAHLI
jgi:hypothetical protein